MRQQSCQQLPPPPPPPPRPLLLPVPPPAPQQLLHVTAVATASAGAEAASGGVQGCASVTQSHGVPQRPPAPAGPERGRRRLRLRTPSVSPRRPRPIPSGHGGGGAPGVARGHEVRTPSAQRHSSRERATPPWKLRRHICYDGEDAPPRPRSLQADGGASSSTSKTSKELVKGNRVRAVVEIRYKSDIGTLVVPVNAIGTVVDVCSSRGVGIDWQGFDRLSKAVVKREQVEIVKEAIVRVQDVSYTQDGLRDSLPDAFRCGRPLQRLVEQLVSGEVDPLKADFLELPASRVFGRLRSHANRRLHCLKQYQERVLQEVKIRVLLITPRDPVLRRFMHCFTSECGGRFVAIRSGNGRRVRRLAKVAKPVKLAKLGRRSRGGRGRRRGTLPDESEKLWEEEDVLPKLKARERDARGSSAA